MALLGGCRSLTKVRQTDYLPQDIDNVSTLKRERARVCVAAPTLSVSVDVESKVVVVHGIHLIIEHGKPHVNADEQDAQLQHNTIRVTQHLDESVRTGEL